LLLHAQNPLDAPHFKHIKQGWVFAGTVEKNGKNRGKNQQKLAKSKTP